MTVLRDVIVLLTQHHTFIANIMSSHYFIYRLYSTGVRRCIVTCCFIYTACFVHLSFHLSLFFVDLTQVLTKSSSEL